MWNKDIVPKLLMEIFLSSLENFLKKNQKYPLVNKCFEIFKYKIISLINETVYIGYINLLLQESKLCLAELQLLLKLKKKIN